MTAPTCEHLQGAFDKHVDTLVDTQMTFEGDGTF